MGPRHLWDYPPSCLNDGLLRKHMIASDWVIQAAAVLAGDKCISFSYGLTNASNPIY